MRYTVKKLGKQYAVIDAYGWTAALYTDSVRAHLTAFRLNCRIGAP